MGLEFEVDAKRHLLGEERVTLGSVQINQGCAWAVISFERDTLPTSVTGQHLNLSLHR